MPQIALPYLYLWSTKITAADFNQLQQEASSQAEQAYLACLKQFKLSLTKNYSYYNTPTECDQLLAELTTVIRESAEDIELQVAALNLKGLCLQLLVKNLPASVAVFSQALALKNKLKPESTISVLTNLSTVLTNQKDHHGAYVICQEINALLATINVAEPTEKVQHIIASALNRMGVSYAKIGDVEAFAIYQKAQAAWPENDIITNNAAITLAKLDTGNAESLRTAEAILAPKSVLAIEKNSFVNLYYRADINIKLAAYAFKTANGNPKEFLSLAQKLLAAAHHALLTNNDYSENYRHKGKARLAYLQSNFFAVQGNFSQAETLQAQAIALREFVVEPDTKKKKFKAKFVNVELAKGEFQVNRHINPFRLFRQKLAVVTAGDELNRPKNLNKM